MNISPLTAGLIGVIALLGAGFYGLLVSRNLIKLVISLQILVKAALVGLVAAGNVSGQINLGQSLAITVLVADVQEELPFPNDHFDRVIAVHVLEHLPNLPAAISEIHRVSTPDATLSVVIPCEGSVATAIARRFSAQRLYERRYGCPYELFIRREHINMPEEIAEELSPFFEITHR